MSLSLAVKKKRCWQQDRGGKSSEFALLRPAAEMKLTCNVWRNIINLTDCRLMILLDSELRVAFAFAETLCECAAVSPREIHRQNSQKPDGFPSQSTGSMTQHAISFSLAHLLICPASIYSCLVKGPQWCAANTQSQEEEKDLKVFLMRKLPAHSECLQRVEQIHSLIPRQLQHLLLQRNIWITNPDLCHPSFKDGYFCHVRI